MILSNRIKSIEMYLDESKKILNQLGQLSNENRINSIINILNNIRTVGGRLFILGVGGSSANASHAVNDFRKIAKIETYTPTDNVAELTARINDDGWESSYSNWLDVSKINKNDCVMILSVGGGNLEKNVSVNLIRAIDLANSVNAKVIGIVGRDGGYTSRNSDAYVIIPIVNQENITPHTEEMQSLLLHLIVTELKE